MPINLKQLRGEALSQITNQALDGTGLRANINQNGLQSISGNFNQLLRAKSRRGTKPLSERADNATPNNSKIDKVRPPIVFPYDLDNEHYMMFHIMDRRRPSRLNVVTKRSLQTIILPIPSTLTDTKGVSYNTENLSAIGAIASGRMAGSSALTTAGDLVSMAGQRLTSFAKVDGKTFDGAQEGNVGNSSGTGSAVATSISGMAAGVLAGLGGGGTSGLLLGGLAGTAAAGKIATGAALAEGVAANPHTAILFDNVNFREFQFAYKFIARNQKESDDIKEIINAFQYAMHPNAAGKFAGFAYEYPEEFEIEFADAIKDYMFKVGRCVLKTFTVNYNGENTPSFFETSGAPVSVEITLGFQETQLLSKETLKGKEEAPFEMFDDVAWTPTTDGSGDTD